MNKSTKEKSNLKAIKKALCRIENETTKLFVKAGISPIEYKEDLLKIRIDIDNCVKVIEKYI